MSAIADKLRQIYDGKESAMTGLERLGYTHFRAINPPAIAQAKEQG